MGESFQKLNLTNAYLFAAALQDEEICRNLLEIVLNKEIPRVKAHAEHTLFLDSDFKSVRFDVYASDEDEVSYDVEMQKVMEAVRLGGEAIMDLSSHGNTQPFRQKLTRECPAMIGTVPVYDSVIHYQRDLDTLTAKDFY